VITCCYCCGVLKPEGEDEEEGEEMLPKRGVVAQPVTIVSPVMPAKKPPAVVKAEPVVLPREEPQPPLPEFRAPPREIGQGQGATGAHMPLLHFYTLP
jgi:hypothetical protein